MDSVIWCHICLWYFAICLQLSSSKEAIIKDHVMKKWFRSSYALDGSGELWSTGYHGPSWTETCGTGEETDFLFISVHVNLNETFADLMYVDVEAELTLCRDGRVPCYSNYFEVYIYRGKDQPVIPYNPNDRIPTQKFLLGHFFPVYNITNKISPTALNKRQNQTFTFLLHKTKGVTFGIRSRGACGKIYRMKMYYYYCEERFINSIKFENTASPVNGSKQVLGNCSLNSLPSNNGRNLYYGYCHSNGSWSINDQIKCLCIAGHEPNKKLGCSPCPTDYFKPNISNSNCAKCPSNTNSINSKTSCECKDGYYRFQNSSILSCYGLVQLNENPIANFNNGNITIRWSKASSSNSLKEQILYDVECYSCNKCICNGHCVGENYDPGQFNLIQRSVVVSNLSSGTYVFRIHPKNSLNNVASKEKWNFSETDFVNVIKPTSCQDVNEIYKTSDSDSDSDYTTILVVAISTAVVALLLGFLIGTFWERRKKPKNTETTFLVEMESMPAGEINENSTYAEVGPPRATDISSILALFQDVQRSDEAFWEFPRKRLTMLRKLGEGSFGTVNKAKVTPIHAITSEKVGIVAVKMLKENTSLNDKRDFMSELNLMKKLEPHPHVVQLLGCCTNSEPFFLILEYLVGGDLLGYLRKSRGYEDPYNTGEYVPTSRLGEKDLLSFAWMISDGMNYLSSKGIVHRDLAARNVLVGEDNICKVSDFGLAREGSYERKSKARLPAKWMAPEDLLHGQCTSMSDIWSYGILLWEIFTIGDSPYPGFKGRDVFRLIESGYRMPKPSHFSDKLYSLMMDCWNDEAIKRPKFSHISSFFHKMLEDFTAKAYLDLTKFDDHHYENFDVIQ